MANNNDQDRKSDPAAWRAIDAAANRASEAFRVLEDTFRFMLNSRSLTEDIKQLRHDLAAALLNVDPIKRVLARNVLSDVGTDLEVKGTLGRCNTQDVIASSAARGEQALRSLQEFSALVSPQCGRVFDQLRYRLYTIEQTSRAVVYHQDLLERIDLCVLVDGGTNETEFYRHITSLFEAGVSMVQIRDKVLDTKSLLDRTKRAVLFAKQFSAIVIVNDRADIALAAGASGVHVGAEDLSVQEAQSMVGLEKLVGRTTHSAIEATDAQRHRAAYIGVGPCYQSKTKPFSHFATAELLSQVANNLSIPVFAIGGIKIDHLESIFATGISRVAVASAITRSSDPAAAAKEFLARLSRNRERLANVNRSGAF